MRSMTSCARTSGGRPTLRRTTVSCRDQVEPDQRCPFQVPSEVQLVRAASLCARLVVLIGGAEDVLFAGEGDAVGGEVVGAASGFDGAGAGAVGELLRVVLRCLGEQLAQGDFAAALGLAVGARDFLAVVGDESLDLVGREVRVFLQDECDRSRRDRGGFAAAGPPEVPVAEQAFGVVDVDVAVRDAQALDVRTDRDEVGVLAGAAAGGAGGVVADDVVVEGSGAFGVVAADAR